MTSQKYTKIAVLITLLLSCIGTIWGSISHSLQLVDIILCVLGMVALAYTVYFVVFFCVEKIQRDVILVKKNYWFWVLLLVVAIPFVFARFILLTDVPNLELLDEANSYAIVHEDGAPKAGPVMWSVFFHYIDSGNQHITSAGGRAVAGVLTLFGIFLFNGLLVSTILSWASRRKSQWQNGAIRYPLSSFQKNRYAVVIGANEVVASVIKTLLRRPSDEKDLQGKNILINEYVVLQTSENVDEVRELLSAHLTDDEINRVICYNARRNSAKEIAFLHLAYATEIFILGESTFEKDAETAHDALNMHCLNLIAHELKAYKENLGEAYTKKICRVMFDYNTTYSVFQYSDVASDVRETMVFTPFNMYEAWARKVIVENKATNYGNTINYTPLDGHDGIGEEDDKRVHFVIIGMTKMGISMAEQALYHAHYLNYNKHRSRISFIDPHADQQMAFFKGRHATLFELMRHRYIDTHHDSYDMPWIDPMDDNKRKWHHLSENGRNFIDVEIEFLKGDIESDIVREYLRKIANDQHSKLTIAVCHLHTHQALAASLYMPIEVYESEQLQDIWVYQREAVDMVANLTDESVATSSIRYKKLRPFGMLYGEGIGDERSTQKAMLVNAAYDVIYNHSPWPKRMGDMQDEGYRNALNSWNNLMVNKKWSNCFFADSINQKIRSVLRGKANMSLEDALKQHLQALVIAEHNRWNMEQLLMGYAPCKKADDDQLRELVQSGAEEQQRMLKKELKMSAAKVHPNICDYDHLSSIDPAAKDYDLALIFAIAKIESLE